jgi:hypothetical protein
MHIECSLELVNISAAKTKALKSCAKTGAPWVDTSFFLRTVFSDF